MPSQIVLTEEEVQDLAALTFLLKALLIKKAWQPTSMTARVLKRLGKVVERAGRERAFRPLDVTNVKGEVTHTIVAGFPDGSRRRDFKSMPDEVA